ncbi:MAG: GntR family transcriptional regulator [Lachnospiraceae bacterium]|nr:GntR family transcriptional regulator [Lachnospiraceae bacterium]
MSTKYQLLADQLRDFIRVSLNNGTEKLPTEMELCAKYRISRQTVRKTLSLLEQENLILRRQGSGIYLTGILPDSSNSTIGLLVPNEQEYTYPTLISDIKSRLSLNHFKCQVFVTGNRVDRERQILEQLLERPLRGLMIEGCKSALPNPNQDIYDKLKKSGVPLLFLENYYPAMADIPYIKDDNLYGGQLLVKYLLSRGHKQIAGLFRRDDQKGLERYYGFAAAMRDAGRPVSEDRIGWFDSEDYDLLEKKQNTDFLSLFLQKRLAGCTAVVCYNDEIAYYLVRELQYKGLHIPKDISIVSFEQSYLSELSTVRITSLAHKPHELGQAAAEMILQKCKGISPSYQEIPCQLVKKESDCDIPAEYSPAFF